ncbi:MAG TPA: hypothetical protein VFJ82_12185 [Longimicrobium sp.]|nr:hypothetical protein [Longimicrobium sp.]
MAVAKVSPVNTTKMVREIRDQMHAEMKGMTREQRREYIRRRAAAAEQAMGIPASTRPDPGRLGR